VRVRYARTNCLHVVFLSVTLTALDCHIDYLYGDLEKEPRKISQPHRRKVLTNKWQKIMGQARELLEQNPGFTLFVTGHSLGGALATVFAFEAAASADPIIPKPVLCVTVAAPKSGNLAFRLAMEVSMARSAMQVSIQYSELLTCSLCCVVFADS
jgi:hypothetical protein